MGETQYVKLENRLARYDENIRQHPDKINCYRTKRITLRLSVEPQDEPFTEDDPINR